MAQFRRTRIRTSVQAIHELILDVGIFRPNVDRLGFGVEIGFVYFVIFNGVVKLAEKA